MRGRLLKWADGFMSMGRRAYSQTAELNTKTKTKTKKIRFDAYIESFLDNQIDGEALENLELESLKELGLRLVGERVKFLAAVKKLFKPPGPTAPPPQISVSAVPREDGYNSDAGDSIGGGQRMFASVSSFEKKNFFFFFDSFFRRRGAPFCRDGGGGRWRQIVNTEKDPRVVQKVG